MAPTVYFRVIEPNGLRLTCGSCSTGVTTEKTAGGMVPIPIRCPTCGMSWISDTRIVLVKDAKTVAATMTPRTFCGVILS